MIISDDPEAIRRVLLGSKTVAVVGASPKADRDSNMIAKFLLDKGYDMIPVNPAAPEVLGRKCHPDLKSIPKKVDLVVVFRAKPGGVVRVITARDMTVSERRFYHRRP